MFKWAVNVFKNICHTIALVPTLASVSCSQLETFSCCDWSASRFQHVVFSEMLFFSYSGWKSGYSMSFYQSQRTAAAKPSVSKNPQTWSSMANSYAMSKWCHSFFSFRITLCLYFSTSSRQPQHVKKNQNTTIIIKGTVCVCVYLSRADSLTKLTGNAALLSVRIAAEGVLPTKAGRQRTLLKWVVDGGRFTEQITHGHCQTCVKAKNKINK